MERAYEYRIYPNAAQRQQIERTFGCCRWVYNKCLETKMAEREDAGEPRSVYGLQKMIPGWKKGEAPWLAEADSMALQQAVRDLGRAYDNFFRNLKSGRRRGRKNPYGFPRFKSKRSARRSYRTNNFNGNIAVIDAGHVKLPKLGLVKARVSRMPEGRIVSATVKRVPSGKYFVSLCCVDAGVHDLMTRSDGTRVANPKNLAKSERKLAREQRRLSRKVGARKGERPSRNFEKQRRKVARVHEKVADQRRDAIHKATTDIVRESQAVAVEDLSVRGMMANRKLAKSVADASMGEVLRQLEYKCAWYGRGFARVSRWFPSTQLCGECGCVSGPKGPGGLDLREWKCPECGAVHDRDLNAARNIAAEGKRILEGSAGHARTEAA